MMLYNVNNNQV